MELDPVAVYGALLSTALVVYGIARNRSSLRCVVTVDWPEAQPTQYKDWGIDHGRMFLRIDVTNTGARPVTVVRGGLVLRFDECPDRLADGLRARISGMSARVAPVAGDCLGLVHFTRADTREPKRLEEHDTWSASRVADEVSYEIASAPRGTAHVAGAFAQTSTGRTVYWTTRVIRAPLIVEQLHVWQGGGYFDMYGESPADPDHLYEEGDSVGVDAAREGSSVDASGARESP